MGSAMAPSDGDRSRTCFAEGGFTGQQTSRPERLLHARLEQIDLQQLSARVNHDAAAREMSFRSAGGEHAFRIDPVPRIFDAAEWEALSAGVIQRVRALELFLRDVYGEQRIVRAGVISAQTITSAEHYEPELLGMGDQVPLLDNGGGTRPRA